VAGVFSAETMLRNMGVPLDWSLSDPLVQDPESGVVMDPRCEVSRSGVGGGVAAPHASDTMGGGAGSHVAGMSSEGGDWEEMLIKDSFDHILFTQSQTPTAPHNLQTRQHIRHQQLSLPCAGGCG
jgi:hypothetical protein